MSSFYLSYRARSAFWKSGVAQDILQTSCRMDQTHSVDWN